MTHYLFGFLTYTLVILALMWGAYRWLRSKPELLAKLRGMATGSKTLAKGPTMEIESAMPLEPRKNLYVVRVDGERFLIGTGGQEAPAFLGKLDATPVAVQPTDGGAH